MNRLSEFLRVPHIPIQLQWVDGIDFSFDHPVTGNNRKGHFHVAGAALLPDVIIKLFINDFSLPQIERLGYLYQFAWYTKYFSDSPKLAINPASCSSILKVPIGMGFSVKTGCGGSPKRNCFLIFLRARRVGGNA